MTKVAKKNESTLSEITVSYSSKIPARERTQIHNSRDIFELLVPVFSCCLEHHEEAWAVYMNNQHRVLGMSKIGQGGFSETTVDPKIVLQIALKVNASSVVLAHNHPSGNPTPSSCDDRITSKLKSGASFLDIQFTDHLVICDEIYYSYADEGKI